MSTKDFVFDLTFAKIDLRQFSPVPLNTSEIQHHIRGSFIMEILACIVATGLGIVFGQELFAK